MFKVPVNGESSDSHIHATIGEIPQENVVMCLQAIRLDVTTLLHRLDQPDPDHKAALSQVLAMIMATSMMLEDIVVKYGDAVTARLEADYDNPTAP